MINKLFPSFATALLFILGACSTERLAQSDTQDDVYYSVAKAKEAEVVVQQDKNYVTENEVYADESAYTGYYDDYSVRINRFYRYTPWRNYYDTWSYYDPFYTYSPYNRFNSRDFRVNVYVGQSYGYNPFWNDNYYYGYWGYPYNNYNRWGLQSYYNTYPYYGGYYGNNGSYYGGMGRDIQSSPDYRPRPARGFENILNAPGRTSVTPGSAGRDASGAILNPRSRAERYDPRNTGITPPSTGNTRPASTSSRPPRSSPEPSRGIEMRPTRVENNFPPPSSGSSPSSGGSDNGSSSSSARPTRGN